MNNKLVAGTCAVIAAVGIYMYAGSREKDAAEVAGTPAGTQMASQELKQMVADYSARTLTSESASITSTQLIVDSGTPSEATYNLPEDEFFLSVAPYVENTHPCAIHSLTGCQGEMVSKSFEVKVEDADGKAIMNQTVKSQPNGFIDLWLPRNQNYRMTITHEGKEAQTDISTFKNDDTCLTTMQLS